ncbi:MAG: extracellular solute-binding protein, partial [bacterium]
VYSVLSKPQGVRKAFEVLDELRPHIAWWESGDEPARLLKSGEVTMSSAYNGRMFHAQVVRDSPIQIVWDGQLYDFNFLAIPRGAPHPEAAMSFIRFATRPERLAHQARLIPYAPVRRSARPMVTTHLVTGVSMHRHMPTADVNFEGALRNDYEWWARNQERIDRRFDEWLESGTAGP